MASHEFSSLTTKLLAGYSASARNATVYILDVTHSLHGVPVANNGFAGGLWAGGYDRSISIASNFAGGSADENVLLNRVKRYPVQAPRPSPTLRIFAVKSGDLKALEIAGTCPLEPIRTGLLRSSAAWRIYQPDSPASLPKPRM